MGAFLAALGAVLLFILRDRHPASGGADLMVLLLLCPFCADLCWEHGVLTVKAGALGITFPVFQYPSRSRRPHRKTRSRPGALARSGKVCRMAGRAQAEKGRGKRPAKGRRRCRQGKQARPAAQKAKITLEILCTMLKGAGTLTKAVFGALRITKNTGAPWCAREDPAAAARSYGKLQAWLYPVLGVLDRFLWLQFDELRILPDFGSGQPTVEDRVSCRVSAQALFIVVAAVRVLYEFWRKKYWTSSYNVVHYTCIRIC